jgi:hypothetical protein
MGMDVPPAVRTLFLVLTGEEWPQVDEDGLLDLGNSWGKAAKRLRHELEPQLSDSVRGIRSSFFGAAEQGFADMMAPYSVDKPHYLESAAEQFDSANKFLGDTSVQVQYVKLISILSLIELLAEIAWALGVAPFFPSVLTWLAARVKIVEFLLDRLWGRLLVRIATAEVMGMAFQVAMDAIVQALQLANGSRKHWDAKLTIQALEVGALGGALGVPFQALAERAGKALGDKLVKIFGADAAKIGDAARKAVDDNIADVGSKSTKDIAERIAVGIDRHAGEAVRDRYLRHTGTHLVDTVQEGLHEAFTEGLYGALTGQGFSFNPFSFTSGAFSGQTSLARRNKSKFATDLEASWNGEIATNRATRAGANRSTVDDEALNPVPDATGRDSTDPDSTGPVGIKLPVTTGTVAPPAVQPTGAGGGLGPAPTGGTPAGRSAGAGSAGAGSARASAAGSGAGAANSGRAASGQGGAVAGAGTPGTGRGGTTDQSTVAPPTQRGTGAANTPPPPATASATTGARPAAGGQAANAPGAQPAAQRPPGQQPTRSGTGQPVTQASTRPPATQQGPGQQAAQQPPGQPSPGQPSPGQPAAQQGPGQQSAQQGPGQQSAQPTSSQQATAQQSTGQQSTSQQAGQQTPGQQSSGQQSTSHQSGQRTTGQQRTSGRGPAGPAAGRSGAGQQRTSLSTPGQRNAQQSTGPASTRRSGEAGQTTATAGTSTPPPAGPGVAATAVPAPATASPGRTRDTPSPSRTQRATPAPGTSRRTAAPSRFGPAPSTPGRPGVFVADPTDSTLVEMAGKVRVPPGFFAVVGHARAGQPVHSGRTVDRAAMVEDILARHRDWVAANGPAEGIVLVACGLGADPAGGGRPFAADLAAGLTDGETVLASADDVFVDPDSGEVTTGRPVVGADGTIGWQPAAFAAFSTGSQATDGWTPTGAADLAAAVRLGSSQSTMAPAAIPAPTQATAAANPGQHRRLLRDHVANWRPNSATAWRRSPLMRALGQALRGWHGGNAQLMGNLAGNRADLLAVQTAITNWEQQARPTSARRPAVAALRRLVQNALTEIGLAEVEANRVAQVQQRFRVIDPALSGHARRTGQTVVEAAAAHQAYLAPRVNGQLAPASLNTLDANSQQRVADRLGTVVGITVEPGVTAADVQRAITSSTNPVTNQTTLPELGTYLTNMGGGPLSNVTGPAGTFAPQQQTHHAGGSTVTAHVDPSDPAAAQRVNALLQAVQRVAAAGFTVPAITAHLPRYGRSLTVTANGAQSRGPAVPRAEFIAPASIVLSPEGTNNPIATTVGNPPVHRNLSTTLDPTGVGTMVHELGHFLHHTNDRARFWDLNFAEWNGTTAATAAQVSSYATDNPREFVAETFLGLVYGRQYPAAVLALYADLGGALPDRFIADRTDRALVDAAHAAQAPPGYFPAVLHGRDGEALVNGTPAARAALIDRIVAAYQARVAANGPASGIALLACGLGAAPATPNATAFAADLAARLGPTEEVLASAADVFVDPATGDIHSGRSQVNASGTVTWTPEPFSTFTGGPTAAAATGATGLPSTVAAPSPGAVRLAANAGAVPTLNPSTGPTLAPTAAPVTAHPAFTPVVPLPNPNPVDTPRGTVVGPLDPVEHRERLADLARQWQQRSGSWSSSRSPALRAVDRAVAHWNAASGTPGALDTHEQRLQAIQTAVTAWQDSKTGPSRRDAAITELSTRVRESLAEVAAVRQQRAYRAHLQTRLQEIAPALAPYVNRVAPLNETAPEHVALLSGRQPNGLLGQPAVTTFDGRDVASRQATLARPVAITPYPGMTPAAIQQAMTASLNSVTAQTTRPELASYLADTGTGQPAPVQGTVAAFEPTTTSSTLPGGSTITIHSDPTDTLRARRVQQVTSAITDITQAGFDIGDLAFHLPKYARGFTFSAAGAEPLRGIHRAEFLAPAAIVVSPEGVGNPLDNTFGGEYEFLSTQLHPRDNATIVHEIGHFLHRQQSPQLFWDLKMTGFTAAALATSRKVSHYARSPREFVAEVFLGLVNRIPFDDDVLDLYTALGGPMPRPGVSLRSLSPAPGTAPPFPRHRPAPTSQGGNNQGPPPPGDPPPGTGGPPPGGHGTGGHGSATGPGPGPGTGGGSSRGNDPGPSSRRGDGAAATAPGPNGRVWTERFDPARSGARGDGTLAGRMTHVRYDVATASGPDGTAVRTYTVDIHATGRGLDDPTAERLAGERGNDELDELVNAAGHRFADGSRLAVKLRVVPAGAPAHFDVDVHAGTGTGHQTAWYAGARPGTFGHEVLHALGLRDSAADRDAIFRPEHDHGLMGADLGHGDHPALSRTDLDTIDRITRENGRTHPGPGGSTVDNRWAPSGAPGARAGFASWAANWRQASTTSGFRTPALQRLDRAVAAWLAGPAHQPDALADNERHLGRIERAAAAWEQAQTGDSSRQPAVDELVRRVGDSRAEIRAEYAARARQAELAARLDRIDPALDAHVRRAAGAVDQASAPHQALLAERDGTGRLTAAALDLLDQQGRDDLAAALDTEISVAREPGVPAAAAAQAMALRTNPLTGRTELPELANYADDETAGRPGDAHGVVSDFAARQSTRTAGNTTLTTWSSADDVRYGERLRSVTAAIGLVEAAGFQLPPVTVNLPRYGRGLRIGAGGVTETGGLPRAAFHPPGELVLSPAIVANPASAADAGAPYQGPAAPPFTAQDAVVVRQLGRLLHYTQNRQTYHDLTQTAFRDGARQVAALVSAAAAAGPHDFVAEVFLGLVLNHQFPPAVLTLYTALGGPRPPHAPPVAAAAVQPANPVPAPPAADQHRQALRQWAAGWPARSAPPGNATRPDPLRAVDAAVLAWLTAGNQPVSPANQPANQANQPADGLAELARSQALLRRIEHALTGWESTLAGTGPLRATADDLAARVERALDEIGTARAGMAAREELAENLRQIDPDLAPHVRRTDGALDERSAAQRPYTDDRAAGRLAVDTLDTLDALARQERDAALAARRTVTVAPGTTRATVAQAQAAHTSPVTGRTALPELTTFLRTDTAAGLGPAHSDSHPIQRVVDEFAGTAITMHQSGADQLRPRRVIALYAALRAVADAGFELPDLEVHLPRYGRDITVGADGTVTTGPGLPPVRYHGSAGLVIAPELVGNPVPDRTAGANDHLATDLAPDGTAAIARELGQALAHRQHRGAFHELARATFTAAARATAGTVSAHAASSPRAFVGEVFLGMLYGRAYPAAVLDLYHVLGGPRPTRAPAAGSLGTATPAPAGNPIHGIPTPAAGGLRTRRQRVGGRPRYLDLRAFAASWETTSGAGSRSEPLRAIDREVRRWLRYPGGDTARQERGLRAIERAVAAWEQSRGPGPSGRRAAIDGLLARLYATRAESRRHQAHLAAQAEWTRRRNQVPPRLVGWARRIDLRPAEENRALDRVLASDRVGGQLTAGALAALDALGRNRVHSRTSEQVVITPLPGTTTADVQAARDDHLNPVTGSTTFPELTAFLAQNAGGPLAPAGGTIAALAPAQQVIQTAGTTITVHHDPTDPTYLDRLAQVAGAVHLLAGRGFQLPPLHIVLPRYGRSITVGPGNITEHSNPPRAEFVQPDTVILMAGVNSNPITRQTYPGRYDYLSAVHGSDGTGTVVHELGHTLHYAQNPVLFGELTNAWLTGVAALAAAEVGYYATGNPREFVAEVFLGLAYGQTYPERVLAAYRRFGGPVPNRPGFAPPTGPAVPATRPEVHVTDPGDQQLAALARTVEVPPDYFAVLTHGRRGEPVAGNRRVDRAAFTAATLRAYRAWVTARGRPGRGIVLLGCGLGPAAPPRPGGPPTVAEDLAAGLTDQELVLASRHDVFVHAETGRVATGRPDVGADGRITLTSRPLTTVRGTRPTPAPANSAAATAPRAPAGYADITRPAFDGMVRLAAEPTAARDALADVTGQWQRYSARTRPGRSGELRAVDRAVAAWESGGNVLRGLLDRADRELAAVEEAVADWRTARSAGNPRRAQLDELARRVAAARAEIAAVRVERARVARLRDRMRQVAPSLRPYAHRDTVPLIETDPIHQAMVLPRRADGRYADQTLDAIDAAEGAALRDILAEPFTLAGTPDLTAADVTALIAGHRNAASGHTAYPDLATYAADRAAGRPARFTGTAAGWTDATRTFDRAGSRVTVHYDRTDPLLPARVTALDNAVRLIEAAGFTVPDVTVHLPRYGRGLDITPAGVAVTAGGPRRAEFHAPATIVASPEIEGNPMAGRVGGAYRFLSTTIGLTHQHGTATASLVHELGHHLHHARNRRLFWDLRQASFTGPAEDVALQVSAYAAGSPREFVAEVFLGLVYGRTYSDEVLEMYRALGGPRPAWMSES